MYDGFMLHPEVPIEPTSILYAMEDDKFEWTQHWINLYRAEADETLKIREEERESQKARGEKKRAREKLEGQVRKKLKVSYHYWLSRCH